MGQLHLPKYGAADDRECKSSSRCKSVISLCIHGWKHEIHNYMILVRG